MLGEFRRAANTILPSRWLLPARAVWVAVFVVAVGLFIAGIPYYYDDVRTICTEAECISDKLLPEDAEALRDLGLSVGFYAGTFTFMVLVLGSVTIAVSSLILWRRSNDWMAMLVSLALLLLGTQAPPPVRLLTSVIPEFRIPIQFLGDSSVTTLILLLFIFPDGRFVPRWTRFPAIAFVLLGIAAFINQAATQANPIPEALQPSKVLLLVGVVAAMGAIYAQVYRYRKHSSPSQQRQSKWVVLALAGFLLFTLPIFIADVSPEPGLPRLLSNLVITPLIAIAIALVPIAVAVSILRYRLWDIDIIINRTLVYGAITAALAIAFVGIALLFQLAFTAIAGQQSPVALIGSALVIGVLFQPVRRRVRYLLDRRFYPEALQGDGSSMRTMPIASSPAFFSNGHYEAIDFLGEGATKKVYSARDKTKGTEVALAVFKVEGMDENDRRRLEREATIALRLGDHPHIVPMYEFGEDRGQPFMVMPVMSGGSLESLMMRSHARLSLTETIAISIDICKGLAFAHSQGVIHRDIKPGNISLAEDKAASIGDFGVALPRGATRLTRVDVALGTPSYMSPEQAQGETATERSDLYSTGATIYEMVSGSPPFTGDSPTAVVFHHVNTEVFSKSV